MNDEHQHHHQLDYSSNDNVLDHDDFLRMILA